MSEWQDISSAPKDGTQILVEARAGYFDVVSWWGAGWREGAGGLLLRDEPKHWQPITPPGSERPTAPDDSYAGWQQKRGMLADKVDWAINEYDQYMLDDAYDAQRVLDQIVAGLRACRAALTEPSGEGVA